MAEAAEALKALIDRLERVGKPVRDLQTEGGGECKSSHFSSWLAQRGIRHRITSANSHNSNGLNERVHGTLMSRVRAVIHARNIPCAAWPEVLQAVVYVLNGTPHPGVHEFITYDLFHSRKLTSLNHLRCLGATCYCTIRGHLHKLDMRKAAAILVGYESDGRGTIAAYRVMDLRTRRVIVSVDVVSDKRDTKPHRANPTSTAPLQHVSVQPSPVPQHRPDTPAPQQLPATPTPQVQGTPVPQPGPEPAPAPPAQIPTCLSCRMRGREKEMSILSQSLTL
jgi:hypothetical protein